MIKYDAIIIGGGAAGLFCAIEAGRRGRRVLVIEHNRQLGRKILISGGGRCNFTNLHAGPANYLSANPRFCISALSRYTPQDFIRLVEKHKIRYYEKTLGQLFCEESAQQIVTMLENECKQARVDITPGCHVQSIEKNDAFRLVTENDVFECDSLVVACGGVSVPKVGATNFGYRVAEQFGVQLTEIRPGLVPLTFFEDDRHWTDLRGISLNTAVSHNKTEFRENILFSHRGLTGPAILQISSYWRDGESVIINLLPNQSAEDLLNENRSRSVLLSNLLDRFFPTRFARQWCEVYGWNLPMNQLNNKQMRAIADALNGWQVRMQGTEGFGKAEVTLGGVDTRELSSKTMESKKAPGLYFIGEVVDVTGHLGGFNFQWAWSSGYCAGQVV